MLEQKRLLQRSMSTATGVKSSAEPAADNALQALKLLGVFDDGAVAFVAEHPPLVPILRQAPNAVRAEFGSDATIIAELYHDPDEGWDKLFLVIASPFGITETLEREERLLDRWFLDHFESIGDLLSLTTSVP